MESQYHLEFATDADLIASGRALALWPQVIEVAKNARGTAQDEFAVREAQRMQPRLVAEVLAAVC